uniref:CX domain-containing protein n=1 Tax=Steinernema glaseri TaxID=37863 RepID=A0A1I8APG0_9BILA
MLLIAFLAFILAAPCVQSIMCYESKEHDIAVSNENFRYCVYHPPTSTHPLKVYGIGEYDEADEMDQFRMALDRKYIKAMQTTGAEPSYRVQSICILENFEFSPIGLGLEALFRCFCSGHLCNTPATFSSFLATNAGNVTYPMGQLL